MLELKIKTTGMHCGSCAALIEMEVAELPGIASVKAIPADGITTVNYDPALVKADEILSAIQTAGYGATL